MVSYDVIAFNLLPHFEKEREKGEDGYKGRLGLFKKYRMKTCINLIRKRMKENVEFDDDMYEEFYFLSREDDLKWKLCDPKFRAKYSFLK